MADPYKLNEEDNQFLAPPDGASVLFSGSTGTETWIERTEDVVVRIGIQSVGVVTANDGFLAVCIELGGQQAKGSDGPGAIETRVKASQSIQLLVKAGERLAFKAYPTADHVAIIRTVVWASDLTKPAG